MAKYSEINYIINKTLNTNNNIRYIQATNAIDYIFYNCNRLILTQDNSIPFSKIICHNLENYNNINTKAQKMLLVHNPPDIRRKKEDIHILKQQMLNDKIECLFFDEYTRDAWSNNDAKIIPYGIPESDISKQINKQDYSNKIKNVIILNFNQDSNIKKLYDKMKLDNIECDYIENMPNTMEKFVNHIKHYRVVINLASINVHCSLICVLCGCFVICPPITPIININSIFQVSSFSEIYSIIDNLKNIKKDKLILDRENIKYNYNESQYQSILKVL